MDVRVKRGGSVFRCYYCGEIAGIICDARKSDEPGQYALCNRSFCEQHGLRSVMDYCQDHAPVTDEYEEL